MVYTNYVWYSFLEEGGASNIYVTVLYSFVKEEDANSIHVYFVDFFYRKREMRMEFV